VRRPRVRGWWERAKSRPSFEQAIDSKLSEDQIAAMASSGMAIHGEIAQLHHALVRNIPGELKAAV
jgi:hypothetical protein